MVRKTEASDTLSQRDHEHATLEARLRLEAVEKDINGIKHTADAAHDRGTELSERLDGVIGWQKRQNGSIESSATAMNNLGTTMSARMDRLNKDIFDRIDTLAKELTKSLYEMSGEIRTLHEERDKEIEQICSDYNAKIADMRLEALNRVQQEMRQVEKAKEAADARVDNVERTLNAKFDEYKNYFSRWFIGITVGIIVSMIIIIVSRVFTVPGGHI